MSMGSGDIKLGPLVFSIRKGEINMKKLTREKFQRVRKHLRKKVEERQSIGDQNGKRENREIPDRICS